MRRLNNQRSVTVQRRAHYCIARTFFGRYRFAGDHRFVDYRSPVYHPSIDRYFFAGPDAQAVSLSDILQRDLDFGAVRLDPRCRLCRQVHQGPQRTAGLFPGA